MSAVRWLCSAVGFFLVTLCSAHAQEGRLLGHWKLSGDVRDASGNGLHALNHGVDLSAPGPAGNKNGAARFDGRKAYLEVPAHKALRLGKEDFTFALWAWTAESLDDGLGDLLSLYDPAKRRGVTWCLKNATGVTTSQPHVRHLHFGIDAATEPRWQRAGRPGNAVFVMALAVHQGELFAGTCEAGKEESGHVYRYAGDERWVDCGSPDRCNAVTSLAVFQGKLYAGVGKQRLAGSALPESANPHLGGKVYRYEGDKKWTFCGQLPDTETVGGLVVFRGKLFASSLYKPAGLFEYQGGTNWKRCSTPAAGQRVVPLTVYNGNLFAGSYDLCAVFRQHNEGWNDPQRLEPSGQTYSFEVYQGELFVGTWPNGRVFRSLTGERWLDSGRLGEEKEVMGMAVYNGKLYAGTLPLAEVYRYDGEQHWSRVGRVDHTPDVRYRRAWTAAVFQGKLFFGTLPSGQVHALEAGKCVTFDRELAPGWRHLAAVKQADRLRLYVDGKLVATSTSFDREALDLSHDQPLRLGAGPHDYFNGRLSDVRLYGRALTASEILALAKKRP